MPLHTMTIKHICWTAAAWMILMTAIVCIPGVWPMFTVPIVLIGLVFVVGVLWAINLGIPLTRPLEYSTYSFGLGLSFLLIGGLFINWALPYVGIAQPLARLPLMIFFDMSAAVLILCALYFKSTYIWKHSWTSFDIKNILLSLLPWIFVIMSVVGALRLNNGQSGIVTILMLFGIALYAVTLVCLSRGVRSGTYVSALYAISLALLLMYSLRSNHIFGWDINLEYEVFRTTLDNLVWKMSSYPGLDYNACLSITIVPTIFAQLMRVSGEYVFKVVFQILFAATPVMVYAYARRYLRHTLAFLSGFLVLSQTWFFEQMPALIRQEIAFIFFILLLLVLFDQRISRLIRYGLLGLFTLALVLSHYSTAYVWVALLVAIVALSYLSQWLSRREHPWSMSHIQGDGRMLVFALGLLFVWEVLLTHTAGQLGKFVARTPIQATAVPTALSASSHTPLETSTPSSPSVPTTSAHASLPAISSLSLGNAPLTNAQNILSSEGQNSISTSGKRLTYRTYSDASALSYVPQAIDDRVYLSQKVPLWVSNSITWIARAVRVLFIGIFPLVGMISMYRASRRKSINRQVTLQKLVWAGISAYALIACAVLVPYIQEYYNLTRLYLQMFFILSIFASLGAYVAVSFLPRYRRPIVAVLAALLFCSLSGAFDQIIGGQARMTLDQPPANLDLTYIYDGEVASVHWLAAYRDPAYPIQADIVANLRLQSFGNLNSDNFRIFPQTLGVESYVYLSHDNVRENIAFYQYQSTVLAYAYPTAFLQSHKNLIYNDGDSEIYR
jgi:uncharacterized membrane protein